jgi:transcription elongation factor GreA
MSNRHVLTPDAYAKLKAELEELKGPVRTQVADAIREAKSHGDLRENAAYHEAKLNQARLDQRIAELEKALEMAKIVEVADEHPYAQLGSKVKLLDLDFDEELEIKLVSSFEADPANDLISISSPLGIALLEKEEGDEVVVEAPAGEQRYRILSVGPA